MKHKVSTDLFSPPGPGGTACKQPRYSSHPPSRREERERDGAGRRGDNRRSYLKKWKVSDGSTKGEGESDLEKVE